MAVEHNAIMQSGTSNFPPPPALPEGETDEPKVYHSRLPGSTFITRDGTVHMFNALGELSTKNKALQFELEQISDKPGSPLFFKGKQAVIVETDLKPAQDNMTRAQQVIAELERASQPKV